MALGTERFGSPFTSLTAAPTSTQLSQIGIPSPNVGQRLGGIGVC